MVRFFGADQPLAERGGNGMGAPIAAVEAWKLGDSLPAAVRTCGRDSIPRAELKAQQFGADTA
jgi:hypothetical protein